MKKFFTMICLFTMLLTAPAFAARTGLDVHKGGFGPKIRGLQLGMPITIKQAREMMLDTFLLNEFDITIYRINGFTERDNYLYLQYRKNKDGKNVYTLRQDGVYKSFERYNNDGAIFDEIEKRGYAEAMICENRRRGEDVRILIHDKRVFCFDLNPHVFGADNFSLLALTRRLQNAYSLPYFSRDVMEINDKYYTYYSCFDRGEGWEIRVIEPHNEVSIWVTNVIRFD